MGRGLSDPGDASPTRWRREMLCLLLNERRVRRKTTRDHDAIEPVNGGVHRSLAVRKKGHESPYDSN